MKENRLGTYPMGQIDTIPEKGKWFDELTKHYASRKLPVYKYEYDADSMWEKERKSWDEKISWEKKTNNMFITSDWVLSPEELYDMMMRQPIEYKYVNYIEIDTAIFFLHNTEHTSEHRIDNFNFAASKVKEFLRKEINKIVKMINSNPSTDTTDHHLLQILYHGNEYNITFLGSNERILFYTSINSLSTQTENNRSMPKTKAIRLEDIITWVFETFE